MQVQFTCYIYEWDSTNLWLCFYKPCLSKFVLSFNILVLTVGFKNCNTYQFTVSSTQDVMLRVHGLLFSLEFLVILLCEQNVKISLQYNCLCMANVNLRCILLLSHIYKCNLTKFVFVHIHITTRYLHLLCKGHTMIKSLQTSIISNCSLCPPKQCFAPNPQLV